MSAPTRRNRVCRDCGAPLAPADILPAKQAHCDAYGCPWCVDCARARKGRD